MSEQPPDKQPDRYPPESSFDVSQLSGSIDLSDYAGRWVAIAGDRVAGVGDTAMSAERLGRRNRLRERLAVYFVEPPGGKPLPLPALLKRIRPILARHEEPVFLVGGTVRDVLLGRSSHDLDFVVPRHAIRLAFKVADQLGAPAYVLDGERDAGRIVLSEHDTTLDFTSFRGADLEADLRDRDFTINAMALPLAANTNASLIDPCGGQGDLKAKLIRINYPKAIEDDPIRGLRAIRMALTFDFSPTPETNLAISSSAPQLDQISIERVRDELIKVLATKRPKEALACLHTWGILPVILPELDRLDGVTQSPPHHETVLNHTGSTLNRLVDLEQFVVKGYPVATKTPKKGHRHLAEAQKLLSPYQTKLASHLDRHVPGGLDGWILLRLGGLFHDVGKAETARVDEDGRIRFFGHDQVGAHITGLALRRFRLSNQAIAHVRSCVAGHMRPLLLANEPAVSRRAVYRFFRASQTAGIDIGLLALADHLATYSDSGGDEAWNRLLGVVNQLFEHYFNQYEVTIRPVPLLDGHDLIDQLHLEPGPEVGRLLRLIEEAQAAGDVNSGEEALALAQKKLSNN
jgi:poly(A) polymerase